MALASVAPASAFREPSSNALRITSLPEEIKDLKIKDGKETDAVIYSDSTEAGHIIVTQVGEADGQGKQTISYMAERVVGQGTFGVVFQ
ncbi:hypothetical protein Droror1_Dr00017979, partial [Drosera rotundifolia]